MPGSRTFTSRMQITRGQTREYAKVPIYDNLQALISTSSELVLQVFAG